MTSRASSAPPPVRVVGIVPAAGASRRMGEPKGLLRLPDGGTFTAHVVSTLRGGGCDPVIVVVSDDPASSPEIAAEATRAGATVLTNPAPGAGPLTSLRLALAMLAGGSARPDLLVWLPLDHPAVDPATVRALVDAARTSGAPVTLPVHQGRRGHPAVFARAVFDELLDPTLEGGARTVVHRHLGRAYLVETDDPGVLQDIDTRSDYEALLAERAPPAPLHPAEAAALLLDSAEAGHSAAAAVVIGGPGAGRALGARLALVREAPVRDRDRDGASNPDGSDRPQSTGRAPDLRGTLGAALDARVTTLLADILDDPRATDGLRTLETPAGTVELYVEVRRPVLELVIVGAGHIARPLTSMAASVGFRVSVLDDRPDFATRERFPEAERVLRADFDDPFRDVPVHERTHILLVTRGHKYDYACLVRALRMDPPPAYIGMIGSRRRVRATYVQLLDDGIDRTLLGRIHAPVGLDVGAETPEEIAVSVVAELVLVRRGGTGRPLRDVERIAERFFSDPDS